MAMISHLSGFQPRVVLLYLAPPVLFCLALLAFAAPAKAVSFAPATNFAVGSFPTSVAVGDLNGDGFADLAVANAGSDNVSVLLGNGAGSLGAATNFAVGSYPQSVAMGNLNGVVQVSHPPFLPGYGPWMKWAGKTDPRIVSPPAQVILDEAFAAREAATPSVEDLFSGDLVLIPGHPAFGTCEKAFHFRPNRLPERPPAEGRQAEPPLVLSYMSFMAQELGVDVVRGILDAGCRAALIDGNNYGLPEEIAGDPRVSILGREPIEELLVQASAIIHGGGSGIAQEALAAGTPQVSVPRNTEQETTGRKLEQFGAGKLVAVSDQPLETIELSSGFRTLAHPSASHLARRITIALSDLLADDRAVEASLQKGNEIRLLPTVDDATIEIENLMAARA